MARTVQGGEVSILNDSQEPSPFEQPPKQATLTIQLNSGPTWRPDMGFESASERDYYEERDSRSRESSGSVEPGFSPSPTSFLGRGFGSSEPETPQSSISSTRSSSFSNPPKYFNENQGSRYERESRRTLLSRGTSPIPPAGFDGRQGLQAQRTQSLPFVPRLGSPTAEAGFGNNATFMFRSNNDARTHPSDGMYPRAGPTIGTGGSSYISESNSQPDAQDDLRRYAETQGRRHTVEFPFNFSDHPITPLPVEARQASLPPIDSIIPVPTSIPQIRQSVCFPSERQFFGRTASTSIVDTHRSTLEVRPHEILRRETDSGVHPRNEVAPRLAESPDPTTIRGSVGLVNMEDNILTQNDPARRDSRQSLSPGIESPAVAKKRERKHPCQSCGKSFTTSGHLARHNRIHTGERKFACLLATCEQRFSRQDNMMQHFRTHSNSDSRKKKRKVARARSTPGGTPEAEDQSPGKFYSSLSHTVQSNLLTSLIVRAHTGNTLAELADVAARAAQSPDSLPRANREDHQPPNQ